MRKKLRLDDLAVESFEAGEPAPMRGTCGLPSGLRWAERRVRDAPRPLLDPPGDRDDAELRGLSKRFGCRRHPDMVAVAAAMPGGAFAGLVGRRV